MVTTEMKVSGMACDGCANKIKKALEEIDGVSHVDVVLDSGHVKIAHTGNVHANMAKFQNVIETLGFDIEE